MRVPVIRMTGYVPRNGPPYTSDRATLALRVVLPALNCAAIITRLFAGCQGAQLSTGERDRASRSRHRRARIPRIRRRPLPQADRTDVDRDAVPGPFGSKWSSSTINGNAKRGTGLLNNELYVGRLVWNRQRFIKNPDTGKRSRGSTGSRSGS
jgi:recombinase